MMDKTQLAAAFAEYFDKHTDEILADLAEIIGIESIADENADVKPFGAGSATAAASIGVSTTGLFFGSLARSASAFAF